MCTNSQERLRRSRRAAMLALAGGTIGLFGIPAVAGATGVHKVVQAGTPQVFEINTKGVDADQITAGRAGWLDRRSWWRDRRAVRQQ